MSDSVKVEFEGEAAPEDFEVAVLEDGEEIPKEEPPKPEGKVLTQAEYDELVRGKDSVAAMTQGLERLGENLQRPVQPINVPQTPGITDEELEQMAFQPGGFKKAAQIVAGQALAQQQAGFNLQILEQNKRLMKLDPSTSEMFTKYEAEIDKRVQALPPQYRYTPNVYDLVYKQVMFDKQNEIIQEKAQKIAQEQVAQMRKELGLPAEGKAQKGVYQEGASRGIPPQKPSASKIFVTRNEVQDMLDRGMDPKDKVQVQSYIEHVRPRSK